MSSISQVRLDTTSPSGLWGCTWIFILVGEQLVVDNYSTWSKETTRHKAKVVDHWSRLMSRESNIPQSEVPLTPAVAAAAKREWLKLLESKVSVGFQPPR